MPTHALRCLALAAVITFMPPASSQIAETKLLDGNPGTSDNLGGNSDSLGGGPSIARDGDVLVVGAWHDTVGALTQAGSATVFRWDGSTWAEEQELTSGTGHAFKQFGVSVAVSGDVIVVGANRADIGPHLSVGSATVFRWNGASWVEEVELGTSTGGDFVLFGSSVDVDGDVIVVGSPGETVGSNAKQGSATVFRWDGSAWNEDDVLSASAGAAGDEFGTSVAMDGDVIVAGTRFDDVGAEADQGSATVFRWDGSAWIEEDDLVDGDGAAGDLFGYSVSVDGDVIAVGSYFDDVGTDVNAGSAVVFRWDGSAWDEEVKLVDPTGDLSNWFGCAVSVSGDALAVGSQNKRVGSATLAGSVLTYRWNGLSWLQDVEFAASDAAASDNYGESLLLSGDTLFVGAPNEDGGAGGNFNQGAVYVYDIPDPWTDLGGGAPGAAGVPALIGVGTLVEGTPASVALTQTPAGALVLAWISLSSTPFAALGGTVHAFPFVNQLFFVADGSGTFAGGTTWPPGIAPGTDVWFQFLVQDGSVPDGITLSDGLLGTTP